MELGGAAGGGHPRGLSYGLCVERDRVGGLAPVPLASQSWLAGSASVGQVVVGFRACGWGGGVPPAGAEGGREVVPGWAQHVWRPGAKKQIQGSMGV